MVAWEPLLTGSARRSHPVQPVTLAQQRPDPVVTDVSVEHDGQDVVQQRLAVLPGPGPLGQGLEHLRLRRRLPARQGLIE